jgi:hypothetical protein
MNRKKPPARRKLLPTGTFFSNMDYALLKIKNI